MNYAPWSILVLGLVAMAVGVGLLFVETEAVRLPALLIVASGIAFLFLWVRRNNRLREGEQSPIRHAGQSRECGEESRNAGSDNLPALR